MVEDARYRQFGALKFLSQFTATNPNPARHRVGALAQKFKDFFCPVSHCRLKKLRPDHANSPTW
jgi:hypothetical protein